MQNVQITTTTTTNFTIFKTNQETNKMLETHVNKKTQKTFRTHWDTKSHEIPMKIKCRKLAHIILMRISILTDIEAISSRKMEKTRVYKNTKVWANEHAYFFTIGFGYNSA